MDEFGHHCYDTTRSKIGELMYRLKYKGDKKVCNELMEIIYPRTQAWIIQNDISVIIGMPPTNKNRVYQPVDCIAEELSRRTGTYYYKFYLEKKSSVEAKSINFTGNLNMDIRRIGKLDSTKNVLLIDDLYKTGITMKTACSAIRTDNNVEDIFTLAITRTRR